MPPSSNPVKQQVENRSAAALARQMACVLRESEMAEEQLLAQEWFAASGLCRVCCGPLEGSPGPECAEDGCPSRDGSDA